MSHPWAELGFSQSFFRAGANNNSRLVLYGLNENNASMPEELQPFGPILIWQDQANSYVEYTSTGQVDTSCGTINSPCTNTPTSEDSPRLELHANQQSHFGGIIYQPRGSWTNVQAAPGYTGPLRIISGAMEVQGSGTLTLTSPSIPLTRLVAALVE
jgi:hypothetical protein